MNNKKAFTIIELVIVIAVIAVLASVAIPIFSTVIEMAEKSKQDQQNNLETKLDFAESVLELPTEYYPNGDETDQNKPEPPKLELTDYNEKIQYFYDSFEETFIDTEKSQIETNLAAYQASGKTVSDVINELGKACESDYDEAYDHNFSGMASIRLYLAWTDTNDVTLTIKLSGYLLVTVNKNGDEYRDAVSAQFNEMLNTKLTYDDRISAYTPAAS